MFDDKTLVGVGCSHVFGSFLDESTYVDKETCHLRSWLKKLESMSNAKDSINLALPGASNKRSCRVIRDFVLRNKSIAKNLVIFVGITEPIRTEIPIDKKKFNNSKFTWPLDPLSPEDADYNILTLGTYLLTDIYERDADFEKYIELYYGNYCFVEYEIQQMNLDIISLHTFFNHFGIEHYFICMLVTEENFSKNPLKTELPIISFGGASAISYAKSHGHKVGKDYVPNSQCNHLDDEGNWFVAKYIKEKIENGL
jgi:hypothetical protein